MKLTTIIKDDIRGNLPAYKEYFLATALSAGLIFMSLLIIFHPEIEMSSMSKNFLNAAKAVCLMVGIFLFIFVFYSEYTFLRNRSRDYAMFSILGMKRKQLTLLNFCESFSAYLTGTVAGMLVAMLFAKLIFMAFSKILDINDMGLYLPVMPVIYTLGIFLLIFVVIQISAMIIIRRTDVKKFLQFGVKTQKMRKINVPIAIISVLVIALAYYLALTANAENILGRIIPVTLMAIVGIYFFYREMCPYILSLVEKRKGFYYKGTNMLWVSDLRYRITDFTQMMFLITVTMSVGLTGFSAVVNVSNMEMSDVLTEKDCYPISVLITTPDSSNSQVPVTVARIENMLDSMDISYSEKDVPIYYTDLVKRNIMITKSVADYFLNETDLSSVSASLSDKDTVVLNARRHHFRVYLPMMNFIIADDDKISSYTDGYSLSTLTLFEFQTHKRFGKELGTIDEELLISTELIFSASLFQYFYFIIRRVYLLLSFYFVIVFYICAGCMLYFKFFNNAVEEGKKYENYSKIGLSTREIRRSSTIQMAILFFLPGVMTVLNTAMAMCALSDVSTAMTFTKITTIIVLFTLFIQVIYFLIIRSRYLKKIGA